MGSCAATGRSGSATKRARCEAPLRALTLALSGQRKRDGPCGTVPLSGGGCQIYVLVPAGPVPRPCLESLRDLVVLARSGGGHCVRLRRSCPVAEGDADH